MPNFFDQFDPPAGGPAGQTEATPAPTAEPSRPIFEATDIARGVVGGARDAIQGMIDTGLMGMEAVSTPVAKAVGSEEATKETYKHLRSTFRFNEVEQNTSVLGEFTRQAVKFGIGFKGAGTVLKGTGGILAQGALGDFAVSDPHAERLSNLVESIPSLKNPVTDFLAADPNDGAAMGKLKASLEGVLVSGLVNGVAKGIGLTRSYMKLKAEGKIAEAEKLIATEGPQVDEAIQKAVSKDANVSIFPEEPVTLYRHGKPVKEAPAFFGQSEGLVEPFAQNGPLHSVSVSAEDAARYKVTNILKDPNADPELVKAAKLAGQAGNEYVLPGDVGSKATEHYGPKGIGTAEMAQAATTRVANSSDILSRVQDHEVIRWKRIAGQAPELEGNLNYAKFNTNKDVKQFMSDVVASAKKDLPDLAGSYQSQEETKQLAQWLGKDATELYTSLHSMRMSNEDLAAHIFAGKQLLKRVSEDTYAVAEKLANGLGTDMDRVGFMHMTDVMTSLMDNVSSLTTSAARATAAGAMRVTGGITRDNFASLLEKVGGSEAVNALARRVRAADDIGGVTAAVRVANKNGFTSIHNFIWMNGVLGGLKTTFTNVSTTAFNSALMPGFRIIGGLADMALTGNGKEQVLQGLAQYRYLQSTWRDSIRMAAKAMRQGESILDASANPLATQALHNPLSAAATGIESESLAKGVEYVGKVVGLPSKFLIAQDEFFKQITYRSHVMASAEAEGMKVGLEGSALKDFVNNKLQSLIGEAGQGLDKAGLNAAKTATFTQDLGKGTIGASLQSLSNNHPVVKSLILPFVKVPTNLFRQAWDMTPGLDLLRTEFKRQLAAGGEERAMALGKMGVGTMFWGSAIGLAMSGRITGGGPKDKDLLRQLGPDWKPYSFVLNNSDGTKSYISFARFDPFATFFGLAADMAEIGPKLAEKDYGEAAGKMSLGLVKNLSSKTYLRAMTDVMEAATGDEPAFQSWLKSRAASYVPGYFQLLNADDELKDIRHWYDGLISRVPGWSQTLEAKRDNFGEKIMPPMGWPYTAFNPFTMYRSTNDPVRKELASLSKDDIEAKFALPLSTIGPKDAGLDLREVKNPKTGQSAYDRLLELTGKIEMGGKTLHESMADLIASPMYKDARAALGKGDPSYKPSLAVSLVQKEFQVYEDVARLQLYQEFPQLGEAAMQYKIGSKIGKVEGSNTQTPIDQLRSLAGQR